MKLIFEKSVSGRGCALLPPCDVPPVSLPDALRRAAPPALPEIGEPELSRHYTELCHHVHGVNCGFYPLGSCTMKYNPRIDEEMAPCPGLPMCTLSRRPIRRKAAGRCWTPRKNTCARSPAWRT